MLNLNKYTKKPELKKEFAVHYLKNGEVWEIDKELLFSIITSSLDGRTCDQNGNTNRFGRKDQAENALGLPYTSTSDFAGLWCCQGMAATFTKPVLTFSCGAMTTDGKPVLIFEDKNEKYFYFIGDQFAELIDGKKERERAEAVAAATKSANKAIEAITEIIKTKAGKQYGKATAAALQKEVSEAGEVFGLSCCLSVHWKYNNRGAWTYVKMKSQYKEFSFSYDFINDNNTIEPQTEPPLMLTEFDGEKVFARREKLKKLIHTKAGELLPLLDEFNDLSRQLNKSQEDTQTHATKIYSLANYPMGVKD